MRNAKFRQPNLNGPFVGLQGLSVEPQAATIPHFIMTIRLRLTLW
jgi:hypothetical protein